MNIEKKKIKFISKKKNFNPKEQYGGVKGNASYKTKPMVNGASYIKDKLIAYPKSLKIIKRPFQVNNEKLIYNLRKIHSNRMYNSSSPVNTFDKLDKFILDNKEYLEKFYGTSDQPYFKFESKNGHHIIKQLEPRTIFKNLNISNLQRDYNDINNNIKVLKNIFQSISDINILQEYNKNMYRDLKKSLNLINNVKNNNNVFVPNFNLFEDRYEIYGNNKANTLNHDKCHLEFDIDTNEYYPIVFDTESYVVEANESDVSVKIANKLYKARDKYEVQYNRLIKIIDTINEINKNHKYIFNIDQLKYSQLMNGKFDVDSIGAWPPQKQKDELIESLGGTLPAVPAAETADPDEAVTRTVPVTDPTAEAVTGNGNSTGAARHRLNH